jgi:hypothetical protein
MKNKNTGVKPTGEMGALTLVLLVNMYRNQMVSLLLKNGVAVENNATDEQVALLMGNLLRVSKSFYNDLNAFLSNPSVAEKIAFAIQNTADYLQMSGSKYMNVFGDNEIPSGIGFQSQYGLNLGNVSTSDSTQSTDTKKSFWSNLNLGDLFSKSLSGFLAYDTNKANTKIAGYQAQIAQAGGFVPNINVPKNGGTKEDEPKSNTTLIVVLSLVGVALIGTIVYFVAKAKK